MLPEEELAEDLAELGLGDIDEQEGLPPLEDVQAGDEARARYYSASLPASARALLAGDDEEPPAQLPPAGPSRPQLTAGQQALSRRYPRSSTR